EGWRARVVGGMGGSAGERLPGELAGVGECEVRLLRLPVEEAIRARAHSVAGDLVTLEDAGLVGVREVRPAYDGVALVLSQLPSPMLALHLLARRRQLSAGEVVTLGVALAWALAAAHAAGVTHGRLRDADVLIDPGGRPMLAGVGVMGVLGSAGEPADDVRALARMLLSLLDSQSSGAAKLAQSVHQPPSAATELAAVLAAACPAAPIRLVEAADASDHSTPTPEAESTPSQGRRRRRSPLGGLTAGVLGNLHWRRATRLAGVGVGIVVLAAVIGWVSAPGPSTSSAKAVPASAATNWTAVLKALDDARADAFARPGTVAITTFDAAGSSALQYDAAAVASLRSQGAHAWGLRMLLTSVVVQQQSAGQVTLAVTDSRSAYEVLDAKQQVLSRVAARPAARHLIVLRAAGQAQWRVAEVNAVS
ncbi:MAG: hypothetical protein JWN96_1342, partial [Mycobacterium sp.]|nr:hypothetical protein [Mycobacterium sp.]